jgi:DNA processing protein
MLDQQEIYNTLILSRIGFYSLAGILEMYRNIGSATEIMQHSKDIRSLIPDASQRLVDAFRNTDEIKRRVDDEIKWDEHYGVQILCMNDERYPERLRQCDDAPLALFYRGSANLNQQHVVSIIGTRHCTSYGQDIIRHFMSDLRQMCPEVLIVSGLAYGVDINAHRQALQNGYETVGVLAHGLDNLYPSAHRNTAKEMLNHGGLLTEYTTMTNADKQNFVRRNRIVAGMADSTILVESAAHGGGLITARIARDYNRDVFAFPGTVGAPYSEGCNNSIRDNEAGLITSAFDFVKAMGWQDDKKIQEARKEGIERQLFPDLSDEEQTIVNTLQKQNDLQINMLSVQSGIGIARITSLLFSMEMKGILKALPGGIYHLLK